MGSNRFIRDFVDQAGIFNFNEDNYNFDKNIKISSPAHLSHVSQCQSGSFYQTKAGEDDVEQPASRPPD